MERKIALALMLTLAVSTAAFSQVKKKAAPAKKSVTTVKKKPAVMPVKSVVMTDTAKLYRQREQVKDLDLAPTSPTSPSPNNPNPNNARPSTFDPYPRTKTEPAAPQKQTPQ